MLEVITIKDVKVKIGEVCKGLRKSNDLSREDLAELLDVSSTTIQNIENGKNATLDNVLKVANHFGLLQSITKAIDTINTNQSDISLY
ncbi:helix-turn-helix transcriptional regulator [Subsaximicrobium wynnwilliamsii]|uniref:Helix-turn-helix transcriptional regulator n=1 Tax=Subsaximicrobium wynnwilliamsii TaxID=291179 RepID=A0A5C6ZJU9_9FLAO|nr:helix-turn-helix transcriptional regulator [Subsaximicrobium wynnwilliamsii]TXD83870.1 helix-turn-helix transcriptional regulator [Subsaximicrobium wynnwilliamsii]TXD89611.1 helix-turn-helix transcriptional regulator [Subsaximicrobium wynnwilliamsii]TXE02598.1 helix-turn-helix transcriptional regulator [Subsaximicrobium wynnwilliamsii]